jgi:5'-3' exoribonuclease 1
MKHGIDYVNDKPAVRALVQDYLQGLAWVLSYYHEGCSSWTWYFPHLYAPLATDLVELSTMNLEFEEGTPFTPLLQLLSVLPPQSGSLLPPPYADVMTSTNSPLAPYYPLDFEVDANGKRNSWESIVKIPFIDEQVLVDTVSAIDHTEELSEEERLRNIRGITHRYKAPKASPAPDRKATKQVWGNALADNRRPYSPRGPNPNARAEVTFDDPRKSSPYKYKRPDKRYSNPDRSPRP